MCDRDRVINFKRREVVSIHRDLNCFNCDMVSKVSVLVVNYGDIQVVIEKLKKQTVVQIIAVGYVQSLDMFKVTHPVERDLYPEPLVLHSTCPLENMK